MGRVYFGTDGIRGRVGTDPMTVDFALRLASAAARVLISDGGTVLIGKDTRVSGYMFESALEAGFVAAGVVAMFMGVEDLSDVPVELARAGEGIAFFDEISTAPPAVQAALLRVVLERTVGDLRLPDGVAVVAGHPLSFRDGVKGFWFFFTKKNSLSMLLPAVRP